MNWISIIQKMMEDEDEEEEASRYLQIEEVYAVQGQRMQKGIRCLSFPRTVLQQSGASCRRQSQRHSWSLLKR